MLMQLEASIEDAESKLNPASDESISAACTQVLRLIGQGMSTDEKEEWIQAIIYQFGNCPGAMLIEAIIESGGTAKAIREMSRLISDYIGQSQEVYASRLMKLRRVREVCVVAA